MEKKRVCMHPKDVQRVTGKSYRFARLLLIDWNKDTG